LHTYVAPVKISKSAGLEQEIRVRGLVHYLACIIICM